MIDVDDEIKKTIANRAYKLDFDTVYKLVEDHPFILAGGSLCGDEVHDYDVYPDECSKFGFDDLERKVGEMQDKAEIVFKSPNAITVKLIDKDQIVQFCKYSKPSLEELVKSFDFSHVQVGIGFRGNGCGPFYEHVYYTDAFVISNVTRRTVYTGSEYPLSSLMRLMKYNKRGKLTRAETIRAAASILKDVIDRGYKDDADFKNQMDAIDLSIPDMKEASDLYTSLFEKGLVGKGEI